MQPMLQIFLLDVQIKTEVFVLQVLKPLKSSNALQIITHIKKNFISLTIGQVLIFFNLNTLGNDDKNKCQTKPNDNSKKQILL